MVWDRVLALGNGFEEGTLAATVLAQQTVSSAQRQLQSRVRNKDAAVEDEADAGNLDVLAGGGGGQDAGGDAIRQAVLVHLLGQALDLICLVGRSGRFVSLDGVPKRIKLRLIAIYRRSSAGNLGAGLGSGGNRLLLLPLSSALGEALFLGCGRHSGRGSSNILRRESEKTFVGKRTFQNER